MRTVTVTDRLGAAIGRSPIGRRITRLSAELRHRTVPLHWTNLFGVVSAASLIVLFVTGLFLMFFYTPSNETVTYSGSYLPLAGAEMSKALESTLHVSFEVPGGLLARQAHHWAALLLPASLVMQLLTTFFTGGFRRPRRGMWVLLFLIFVVTLVGGWSGYALPDDMLSGTGLRIVEGIALGIPLIGTWASWLLFGGEFPGTVLAHLYPIHIAVVPALLVFLLILRGLAAYQQKPPQFTGPGRSERNVVGVPVLPTGIARATGLAFLVVGVITVISATVTINPIWLYGPASTGDASAGSQPDWYTGFLDGALRLVPPGWELVWLDRTWTLAILVPLGVVTAAFTVVAAYPFIEEWISGDSRDHHLLDRPRDTPTRTGIGVAGLAFFGILWLAGSADLIAVLFSLSIEGVIAALQATLLLGPVVGFELARRVCLGLQRKDRELVLHGFETGRIVRLPGGEYVEVHAPIDEEQRWRIVNAVDQAPVTLRPDERGVITPARRVRSALSRFFFEDRISRRPADAAGAQAIDAAGAAAAEARSGKIHA